MTCWAIIPARPPGEGKSRLSGPLDDAARTALVEAMLGHVTGTVASAAHVRQALLVGPARAGLPEGFRTLADPGKGLNAALQAGMAEAVANGATRVLIVPADLPQLAAQDLELLASAPAGSIAIAPDRHGVGTNALSLPLPEAAGFVFAFGEDSFARHHAEAERLGLAIETIHSQRLERDIDVAEDLPDAAGLTG